MRSTEASVYAVSLPWQIDGERQTKEAVRLTWVGGLTNLGRNVRVGSGVLARVVPGNLPLLARSCDFDNASRLPIACPLLFTPSVCFALWLARASTNSSNTIICRRGSSRDTSKAKQRGARDRERIFRRVPRGIPLSFCGKSVGPSKSEE